MPDLFEFLFKYRRLVYEQGDFVFAAPAVVRWWLLAAVAASAVAVASYSLARGKASPMDRTVMATLRVALLGVLLFSLLQPTLQISTVVPQQNFVGILVDDSRSMQLPDASGAARSDFIRATFTPGESELLEAMAERFSLRFFSFSSRARRIEGPGELTFDGTSTDLPAALDVAREELSGVPLSGLVMLTDGADTRGRPVTEALVPLQAAGVPVFTVGLGEEAVSPDIELGRVEMPRAVLEGSSMVVDVVVTQTGFRQTTVPVIVEDDTGILAEEEVTLGRAGEPVVTRVHFQLDRVGSRRVRFRIPTQDGERVTQNNRRDVWVEVRGEREKILYFEGEPRHEVKFLRRAIQDDDNLQVVVLQRTAPSKFLRLNVDDGDELAGGFPRTREELYRYRGLIVGSAEASFFTHDQLQMIADFVSERGGGFMMVGGRQAFSEGGWAGTPVEEILPVRLGPPPAAADRFLAELRPGLTPAGLANAAIQLGGDAEETDSLWRTLPPVTSVNRITEVKPGATTLIEGHAESLDRPQVLLAHQRYGRGKVLALTAQDTWIWQMHADIPLEDQSHETFWRQLLRWMVDGVPEPVVASVEREQVEPGEPVRLTAEIVDSTYIQVNDAQVTARITSPTGAIQEISLDWTVERDGEYTADFVPTETGDYEVEVSAARDGLTVGTDALALHTARSDDEYFGAGRRSRLLQRIAEETGGQYYTPATVGTLPDDISVTGAGVTLVEDRDLWDMPALFILMFLAMGAEWAYRRVRGLV